MDRLTHSGSANLISKALGAVGAVLLLGLAFFLGLFFLALLLGLAVMGAMAFMARVWWLKRKLQKAHKEGTNTDSRVLEGEYVIVKKTTRTTIGEEKE